MISKIWDLVQQSLIRKHNLVGHLDNKPVAYGYQLKAGQRPQR